MRLLKKNMMRNKRHAPIICFTGSGGALQPFNYIQRRQRDIEVVTVIAALKCTLQGQRFTKAKDITQNREKGSEENFISSTGNR